MFEKESGTVLKKVIGKVRPSKAESALMADFVKRVMASARKFPGVRPLVCGSAEKGTWLASHREVDLFLLFDPKVGREELEKKGLDIAQKTMRSVKGKFTMAYAEHPYLKGSVKFKGKSFGLDIVPAYDIADPSKIKSAVDRTPHHVKFVKSKLNEKLADDVRLLKAFAKASGCYGADVRTQGLSGYLCELLVIKHGSFLGVLNAAKDWNAGHVVVFNGADVRSISERFRAPLIVIDPVDPNRNVSAALSSETFFRFIQASRGFLRSPSERHFFPPRPKPYSLQEVAKEMAGRGTRLYLVRFARPDAVDDVIWPQLRRALYITGKLLEEGGFRVLRSAEWADEKTCVLLFELDVWQVPKVVKHVGPSIYSHKQSAAFLDHYSGRRVFVENDNWVTETGRARTVALDFLKDVFGQPEEKRLALGIPNRLAGVPAEVVSGAQAVGMLKSLPEDYRAFLNEYFNKDLR